MNPVYLLVEKASRSVVALVRRAPDEAAHFPTSLLIVPILPKLFLNQ